MPLTEKGRSGTIEITIRMQIVEFKRSVRVGGLNVHAVGIL
jgi:hypothetical protein